MILCLYIEEGQVELAIKDTLGILSIGFEGIDRWSFAPEEFDLDEEGRINEDSDC